MDEAHGPGFVSLVDDAKQRIREMSCEQTAEALSTGSARVLDVREQSEWAAGHVRGASSLGKGILERDIEAVVPDRGAVLVLYCGGGYRSALAADALQKMGYTNVHSMAGGFRRWKQLGLPEQTP